MYNHADRSDAKASTTSSQRCRIRLPPCKVANYDTSNIADPEKKNNFFREQCVIPYAHQFSGYNDYKHADFIHRTATSPSQNPGPRVQRTSQVFDYVRTRQNPATQISPMSRGPLIRRHKSVSTGRVTGERAV